MADEFSTHTFEREVDRLGKACVKAREAEDRTIYLSAFRELTEYFTRYYLLYVLAKNFSIRGNDYQEAYSKQNEFNLSSFDAAADIAMSVLEKLDELLKRKIDGFAEERISVQSDLSFWGFIFKDIEFAARHVIWDADNDNQSKGITGIISQKDKEIIGRVYDYLNSREESIESFSLNACAETLGVKQKDIRSALRHYASIDTLELDKTLDEESGTTLLDMIEDDENFTVCDAEENKTGEILLAMNSVFRANFLPVHKHIYPPAFTNDCITGWVKAQQKSNESFNSAVSSHWNEIAIEDKQKICCGKNYLCICDEIFAVFIRLKRKILNKELAKYCKVSEKVFCERKLEAGAVMKKCLPEYLNS